MLAAALDVFRLRQTFGLASRTREFAHDLFDDASFLALARRAMLPLPIDRPRPVVLEPFPAGKRAARSLSALADRRVAIVASGGSGALASVVGVARAFEDTGLRPSAISLCSGSALFGFPIAAGVPAAEVASFLLNLQPRDYIDPDWGSVATIVPKAARGFTGILRGDAVEATMRRLVGEMRLADLPIPAYAPIWSVERNRLQYVGPRTHPDMPVARAIRMAISLPLFFEPVVLGDEQWSDGGIVDIFPVVPVLDLEPVPDAVIGINGFYPEDFAGEDMTGWDVKAGSILYAASQVRTCQQLGLARVNLQRLREGTFVEMIAPVPYEVVRGLGFYREFVSTEHWLAFMRAGRKAAAVSLARLNDAAREPATHRPLRQAGAGAAAAT